MKYVHAFNTLSLFRELSNINYTRFHGNQVFSVSPGVGIQVNISNSRAVPMASTYSQTRESTPLPASVAVYAVPLVPSSSSQTDSSHSHGSPIPAIAFDSSSSQSNPPTSRFMIVTLPPGIYPYALMRVQSPEGQQLSV